MSIYNGNHAFTRYKVFGPKTKTTIASLSKLLTPYIALPLKLDGPSKLESIGWVRPISSEIDQNTEEGNHWDMSDCYVGNDFLLRARFEKRKVPQSLIQMLLKQKLNEHLLKTGKSMPKAERKQFKNDLMTGLLKRTLPVLQFTDVLWRESANELMIFTSSKSMRTRIEQLFYQTFGESLELSLVKMDGTLSYLNVEDASDSQLAKRLSKIETMEPSTFATHQ